MYSSKALMFTLLFILFFCASMMLMSLLSSSLSRRLSSSSTRTGSASSASASTAPFCGLQATFIGEPPSEDGAGVGAGAVAACTTARNSLCSSVCSARTASASRRHFLHMLLHSFSSEAMRSRSTVRSSSTVLTLFTSALRSWNSLEMLCSCASRSTIRSRADSTALTTSRASVSISFCCATKSASLASALAQSPSAFTRSAAAF
mmetsp:Transcript_12066/g.26867  ORF Transcript_12066/g.26867 Transcript_12066/m.26867 type:complete len:205 (-) Transcript_12066:647-1261(-)